MQQVKIQFDILNRSFQRDLKLRDLFSKWENCTTVPSSYTMRITQALSVKWYNRFNLCAWLHGVRTGQDLACSLSLVCQTTGSSCVPLPNCWLKTVHFTDELEQIPKKSLQKCSGFLHLNTGFPNANWRDGIKFPGLHLVAHSLAADFFLEKSEADCLWWLRSLDIKARLGGLRMLFMSRYQEFSLEWS